MSERFEWTDARQTGFYLEPEGTTIGDDVVNEGEVALVLGQLGASEYYVIEGTQQEVALLLARALAIVLMGAFEEEDEIDEPWRRGIQDVVVADGLL